MTRRIERKCWAESLCVEPSGQKCCAEGSTPFPNLGFFYGKRLFFIIEEATQTSILCRETLAPEAAPPMQILARSNFERTIRSLGPIPSNLQVIYQNLGPTYQQQFMVNDPKDRTKMLGREPLCRTFRSKVLR